MAIRKRYIYILIAVFITIVITAGYSIVKYTATIDYLLKKNNVDFVDILAVKKLDENYLAVFYEHEFPVNTSGLGVNLLKKTNDRWDMEVNAAKSIDSEMTIEFLHLENNRTIAYGYINDTAIERIEFIDIGKRANAEIIDTDWKDIWLYEVLGDDINIKMYDSDDNLLYQIPAGCMD